MEFYVNIFLDIQFFSDFSRGGEWDGFFFRLWALNKSRVERDYIGIDNVSFLCIFIELSNVYQDEYVKAYLHQFDL